MSRTHLPSGKVAMAVVSILATATWIVLTTDSGSAAPVRLDDPVGFREEAQKAGIDFRMSCLPDEQGERVFKSNPYNNGCGVAIADYDGDGHDDIYFCNQLGKNALYHNKGDGTFEDVTEKAGVGLGDRVCVAATWADTRNKGLQDLYVTSTRGGSVLFRNNGDGTFTDVTKEVGLTHIGHSQTAVFFDYDNDGFLDLLVTNTAQWTTNERDKGGHHFHGIIQFRDLAMSPVEHNVLYHNDGKGNFTKVEKSGLEGKGWAGDAAVFDYDGDGKLDVLITNMFGASQLYHNDGNGKFTDVTKKVLGKTSWGAIGAKVVSVKNDGRLDLFITDLYSDVWMSPRQDPRETSDNLRKKYAHITGPSFDKSDKSSVEAEERWAKLYNIKYDEVVFGNTLFKNDGGGKFREISDAADMETFWPWGMATGDFDNDGFEDVFIPSGMGYPFHYWPNALMMNKGDGTFTDRAKHSGIDPPPDGEPVGKTGGQAAARSSRCAAVADFRGDGRLDLVVNNFNNRAYFFRNTFPKKNYIAFRLTGTKCNRDAIGATVRLYMGDEVMVRQVNPAGGYLSQSSKTLHFGLGDRKKIDRVEIVWPGTNKPQTIREPDINKLHVITQPKD